MTTSSTTIKCKNIKVFLKYINSLCNYINGFNMILYIKKTNYSNIKNKVLISLKKQISNVALNMCLIR